MLRKFFKSDRLLITLCLPFLVVAVGGSGLHHAPVFGLHGCCSGHQQVESNSHASCSCESHDKSKELDHQGHEVAEKPDTCSICQFFATARAAISNATLTEVKFVSVIDVEAPPAVAISFPAGFLARGPPVV